MFQLFEFWIKIKDSDKRVVKKGGRGMEQSGSMGIGKIPGNKKKNVGLIGIRE